MTEYWVVYDTISGEERWRGSGSAGSAMLQDLPVGLALALVPAEAISGSTLDLDVMRAFFMAQIDLQAEAVRQRFLTPGAGQAMTYARKETEARAWLVDQSIATPFLVAEAAATGVTVEQLVGTVIQQADAWTAIGAAIEGMRMGAKCAVAAGATIGGIVGAAAVDWSAFGG